MSLLLRAGRAALAEDMGMTLLPRAHPIMTLCCWRCALSCALCDERGGSGVKRALMSSCGGMMTLPAQHTTFNTLDNWAIKTPPNQKGKGPERKGYRVMAQNMYTIHSVTSPPTQS